MKPIRTSPRTSAVAFAVVTSALIAFGVGAGTSHAAAKPKTTLVCKTVKGKKVCTRVAKKATTKTTKKANASDTTIASASDTTIAHSTDTKAK